MGGVSGAFLLLPFQMSFLGYTNPSVSATNQVYNIIAIPSGVYRFFREGRMVWPLTWVVVAGTLPGVFLGAYARIVYLPDPKNFKLFAAAVLMYIGLRMVIDLTRKKAGPDKTAGEKRFQELVWRFSRKSAGNDGNDSNQLLPVVAITRFTWKRLGYSFYGESFDIPIWGIFSLSFFGLPVYTVAGAALMGTFVTSVAGVAFYQAIAPFYPTMSIAPDWLLGTLFGLGGMAGMYLGARCQKYVPAGLIKWMLAAIIIFTALKYSIDFFR